MQINLNEVEGEDTRFTIGLGTHVYKLSGGRPAGRVSVMNVDTGETRILLASTVVSLVEGILADYNVETNSETEHDEGKLDEKMMEGLNQPDDEIDFTEVPEETTPDPIVSNKTSWENEGGSL